MPSTHSALLSQLKQDYPDLSFTESDTFLWSPAKKTIYYKLDDPDTSALVLHELAHAILGHNDYHRDIELIAMERAAWDYARGQLAPAYHCHITEEFADSTLDTYRDWLHARSTCPTCGATGLQVKQRLYRCLACGHSWRVNEARTCALRRYAI